MNETRYTYPLPHRDEDQLDGEIRVLGIPGYLGLCGSGVELQALFADVLAPADVDRLFTTVTAHVPRTVDERLAAATIRAVRTADDLNSRGNRASQTLLFTWLNDLREHLHLPRYTEPEILAAIAEITAQGAGNPR